MKRRTYRTHLIGCILMACVLLLGIISRGNDDNTLDEADPECSVLPEVDWEHDSFKILKGVNISGWLSQTSTRKVGVDAFFTKKDAQKLAGWGFDHIRLPVDEVEIFTEKGEWKEKERGLIHKAVEWCKDLNMRVILDFHILRSHYFNDTENMTLWSSKAEQDKLSDMWKKLSAEFNQYPNSLLAYELLNEPVPDTPGQWNKLSSRLINELRVLEPDRMIVLDASSHSSIGALNTLEIPQNDPNIILSVHFYTPHLLTHYQAGWWPALKRLTIKLHYPGQLVSHQDVDTIRDSENLRVVNYYNGYYDKAILTEKIQIALDKSKETGLQIHIGEVGCIENTDPTVRLNWMSDVAAICKEHNVAFSVWGYKAGFGIMNDNGTAKDQRVIDVLTQ